MVIKKSKRHINTKLILMYMMLLLFTLKVSASELCPRYDKSKDKQYNIISSYNYLYEYISDLFEGKYFIELDVSEQGVYFTTTSGFTFTIDCSDMTKNKRLEKIGMFGIGETFKPLKKVKFTEGIYYYGVSSFGLKVFIRKEDLSVFEAGKAYFFNRTNDKYNFCTNERYCDGEKKELGLRSNFAITNTSKLEEVIKNMEGECADISVNVFKGKGYNKNSTPEFNDSTATVEYCINSNRLDYKTLDSESKFISNLSVTGHYFIFSNKILESFSPLIIVKKNCQVKYENVRKAVYTIGGDISLGFDYKLLGASVRAGASTEVSARIMKFYDTNKQYIIYSYYSEVNSSNVHKKALSFMTGMTNDIRISQECNGKEVPTNLNEILIHVSKNSDDIMSVKTKDITDITSLAREKIREVGVWRTANTRHRLKGRIWVISGIDQYINWQHLLYEHFMSEIDGIIPDGLDSKTKRDYVMYYRYLFMATSFQYLPADEVDDFQENYLIR